MFTEEQLMFQRSVRRFANDKIAPLAAQIDQDGQFPEELYQLMAQQEFISLPYPEEFGGSGGDLLSVCIITEEFAKVCTNSAMYVTGHELGMMPVLLAGTQEQKMKYIPKVASGEQKSCFGLTEVDAGSDAAGMKTRAVLDGDYYVVNGSKRFITYSDTAEIMTLFAKTNPDAGIRGISAFILELKKTEGVSIGKHEDKMGMRGLHTCEVFFDNVRIPRENLLGKEGSGFKTAMLTLDKTRPLVGAMGVGLAQGALDYAIEYSKQRVQFGNPIASFQGLQFMMADMAMQIEAARHLVYEAARMVDANSPEAGKLGAMAKCFGTDAAMRVTTDSIQIMGGVGYMKEYPLERKMRDAKLLQIVEGTNQIQRVVIARSLVGM